MGINGNNSIRRTTLNRGEWAEFYVMLRLLGEGKLYTADALLRKNYSCYLELLKIIRQEFDAKILEYIIDRDNQIVSVMDQEKQIVLAQIPENEFMSHAKSLFNCIKNSTGRSFHAPDNVCNFAQVIMVNAPKSPAKKALRKQFGGKNDIILKVRDSQTSLESIMGFSIKSKFNSDPTLFNAGTSSQFLYKIDHCTDSIKDEFNDLKDEFGHRGWKTYCVDYLRQKNISLEYVGTQYQTYGHNLELVEGAMDKILAWCVKDILIDYSKFKKNWVKETTERMAAANPLNVFEPNVFYEKKVKDFLIAGFAGMTAGTKWDGTEQVNGGYIVVMDDGDVLCYHNNSNREAFRDYLYRNTHFEYVSADKFHWGRIIKENDDYYLPLNISIRFNKLTR